MTTETTTTGNDIIDATQNAVISAAENVSEIIEKTSENIHGHGPFYHNPEFWVGLAFILVVPVGFWQSPVLMARPQPPHWCRKC